MAVTAPTYVLEESLSSQKLWKFTAGNRPPQPVEERAFYEKIWAQNFSRSQVKYEIPAEVLTATSPISLSPFADGNFNLDSHQIYQNENYNIGSVQNGHTVGTTSEAEAAEASLLSLAGRSAAASLYGVSRANNLKTLGPHNHHHTLVNKKVKGESDSDDELTVVVRGDNVFGTTVSKSFPKSDVPGSVDPISISIASYRVVEVSHSFYSFIRMIQLLLLTHRYFFSPITVEQAWKICSVSGHILCGVFSRYSWCMEEVLRL
jgi:hypothetical protein